MKIETPVATMGIRGTTGWVQEIASVTANLGNVSYSFAVVDDYRLDRPRRVRTDRRQRQHHRHRIAIGYVTYVTPQGTRAAAAGDRPSR